MPRKKRTNKSADDCLTKLRRVNRPKAYLQKFFVDKDKQRRENQLRRVQEKLERRKLLKRRRYKMIGQAVKEGIVFARFGRMQTGETECTLKQIADSFKMSIGAVAKVIKDFTDRGDVVMTGERGRRAPPIPN